MVHFKLVNGLGGIDGDEIEDVVPVEAELLALNDLSNEFSQWLLLESFYFHEEGACALVNRV